ncbi:S-adenosyl-L-methionine-dependent methyltransferase [Rhizophagus diaphanus]|nr:S-adenosyl-L-methionine-dependent methyltransferase [Rhizophagus diaphanus] [Rhizophagus sp. MUCL 43196]
MGINLSKKRLRPLRSSGSTSTTTTISSSDSSILTRNDSFTSQEDLEIEPLFPLSRSQYEQVQAWKEQHLLSKETWGEHFIAPVNEWLKFGVKVLDMGCGTGMWLTDVGSEYPLSDFIGVDILPLIIKRHPPNVEFIQADIKIRLPFPDMSFDYIQMRHMLFYFTENDWKNTVIPELIRVLKPGGYLEIAEADIEWYNASPLTKTLISAAHNVMRQRGIDPFIINRIREIMDNTGMFQEIYHKTADSQIGKWEKTKGERVLKSCVGLFTGIRVPLCRILQISDETFDSYIKQFKADVDIYKTYCKVHRFYAAKKY